MEAPEVEGRKKGEWRRDLADLYWDSQSKRANAGKRKCRRRRGCKIDPRLSAQECKARRDLTTLWFEVMMLKARPTVKKEDIE